MPRWRRTPDARFQSWHTQLILSRRHIALADFASARSSVEHPLHQTYIRDHASKVISDRVIVQHNWTPPPS